MSKQKLLLINVLKDLRLQEQKIHDLIEDTKLNLSMDINNEINKMRLNKCFILLKGVQKEINLTIDKMNILGIKYCTYYRELYYKKYNERRE